MPLVSLGAYWPAVAPAAPAPTAAPAAWPSTAAPVNRTAPSTAQPAPAPLYSGWVGVPPSASPDEVAAAVSHNAAVTAQWVADRGITAAPDGPTTAGGWPSAAPINRNTPVVRASGTPYVDTSRPPPTPTNIVSPAAAAAAVAQAGLIFGMPPKRLATWAAVAGVALVGLVLLVRRPAS